MYKYTSELRADELGIKVYTICPADNATAGSLGRRRAGQLRFRFVAVSAGHIVYKSSKYIYILLQF
jgi:hypothetical protein